MNHLFKLVAPAAAFLVSSFAMAQSVVPMWKCQDTVYDKQTEIYVDVDQVSEGLLPGYQMTVTLIKLEPQTSKKQLGPYSLIFKKSNPMTGTALLFGKPLSFLLGFGDDRDHVFAQLEGELEGKKVVINLNCKSLQSR